MALLVACFMQAALAGSIEPTRSQLRPTENGYALSTDFNIDLGNQLEEAIARGITLSFTLTFTVERPRWYWFNERVVDRTIRYHLSYNALTHRYRLSTGGLYSSYPTLDDALRVLGHLEGLVVASSGALKPNNTYYAQLQLELDKNQLPQPFQLDSLTSRTWQVDARTLTWEFTPGSLPP